MLWGLLLVALLIALGAYGIVAISRAARTHRARSEERSAALMLELRAHGASTGSAQSAPAHGGTQAAPATPLGVRSDAGRGAVRDQLAAPATEWKALRRPLVLTDSQRLLYLLARSALPDHVVLANMRAIDLLDLPAGPEPLARNPRLGTLLHQRLDCVICTRDLAPLAALVVYPEAASAVEPERELVAMLRELRVRFLRLRSDSLPRPAEMRSLVLG